MATPPNIQPTPTPEPVREQSLLGRRYRVVERLARGGTATIWRARDERLGRAVAVKVLDPSRSTASEARALARLAHPNIAAVYDVGRSGQVPYLVMELIDGRSVGSVLAERGRLPWRTALDVCAQIADALTATHARGIVHHDITSGNVMLTATGVKLVDFGISAVQGTEEDDSDLSGTPGYVAPERLRGGAVSTASDVYALGVLLYRCLSGRLPWLAPTPQEVLVEACDRDPDPLPAIPGLPDGVADLCLRCLARDPARRPTAGEVASALRAAADPGREQDTVDGRAGVASDVATTVTQLLPTLGPTGAGSGGRRSPKRLAARFAMVAAVLLLSASFAWSMTGWSSGGPVPTRVMAAPPAPVAPADAVGVCAVTYRQLSDDGESFTALISLSQYGARTLDRWQVDFRLPADQRVDPRAATQWRQTGNVITSVTAAGPLTPGTPMALPFAGIHRGSNPLPTVFHLDGHPCQVTILGQTGSGVTAGARTTAAQPATARSAETRSADARSTDARSADARSDGDDQGDDEKATGEGKVGKGSASAARSNGSGRTRR